MYVRLLGTAAGGGYPQWNCCCTQCGHARSGRQAPRLHSSLAFSGDGKDWYLINATPDVRQQIESCPELHPGPNLRSSPIKGVFLTDAELDHTAGLLLLREGTAIDIYATAPVLAALDTEFPLRKILSSYTACSWNVLLPREAIHLDGDSVSIKPVSISTKMPRYVKLPHPASNAVVAFEIQDLRTGRSIMFAPALESVRQDLIEAFDRSDLLFFDGTLWTDNELQNLGVSNRSAAEMGHLPLFVDGKLNDVCRSGARRKILIHVNNTNPVMDDKSFQRELLAAAGVEVVHDGAFIEV